jgi:hypothetical protein
VYSDRHFQRLLQATPSFTMLDDHEVEDNFEGGIAHRHAPAGFDYFQRWSGNRNPTAMAPPVAVEAAGGARAAPRYWYSFWHGPRVAVFVLDTRTRRESAGGHHSMLGAAQLAELRRWLVADAKAAAFKIIASPNSMSRDGGNDAKYRGEFRALLAFIAAEGVRGVVVLSGDMHYGAAYRYEYVARDGTELTVREFSASPFQAVPELEPPLHPEAAHVPAGGDSDDGDDGGGGEAPVGDANGSGITVTTPVGGGGGGVVHETRVFLSHRSFHFGHVAVAADDAVVGAAAGAPRLRLDVSIYGYPVFKHEGARPTALFNHSVFSD